MVEARCAVLNAMLENRGSTARVEVASRNSYHALELTTAEYLAENRGHAVKTLRLGSTSELADYVYAMQEGIFLLDSPWNTGPKSPGME